MEQTKKVTKSNGAVAPYNLKQAESFLDRLHDQPNKSVLRINNQANGSLYIPIDVIEMKLDQFFAGLWSTENFQTNVIANEVTGSIDLKVFHPVAKLWITRVGAASVPIQQRSKSAVTDLDAKIKNALVKNFPALKAECLKNAAKSLGVNFGRDLNRDSGVDYTPISETVEQHNEAKELIDTATSKKMLVDLWNGNPQWHQNDAIIDAFLNRQSELQAKKPSK